MCTYRYMCVCEYVYKYEKLNSVLISVELILNTSIIYKSRHSQTLNTFSRGINPLEFLGPKPKPGCRH